ncbi:MAG: PilX N-terminal domain-containing pilus assembly protein [Methylococcaceae bacterium]|nr:PilX N-terminal domain-containing pilus assembly protein [Methylococcaceae bacterium]
MKKIKVKIVNQSGVVLVVSLIMLLLLTLIGVSGMQTTALEEKMASNSRDQNIAFQAAEAALRAGELFIENAVSSDKTDFTTSPTNADGLHLKTENLDYKAAATWSDAESVEYAETIPLVAANPRYYIEYINDLAPNSYFRVTARGTGRQSTSHVYLRSYYGKKF